MSTSELVTCRCGLLLKRTNNIGPTTDPWGTPCAVVQRMELCLQSIDFEVGRWCMGTFIEPYKKRPAIKLYKLHNNLVCFLFKALCAWWKAKLQASLGCQIIKKKFSQFSSPSDEFLCYHTRPNEIMVVSDDQTTVNLIWIESIFRLVITSI